MPCGSVTSTATCSTRVWPGRSFGALPQEVPFWCGLIGWSAGVAPERWPTRRRHWPKPSGQFWAAGFAPGHQEAGNTPSRRQRSREENSEPPSYEPTSSRTGVAFDADPKFRSSSNFRSGAAGRSRLASFALLCALLLREKLPGREGAVVLSARRYV